MPPDERKKYELTEVNIFNDYYRINVHGKCSKQKKGLT